MEEKLFIISIMLPTKPLCFVTQKPHISSGIISITYSTDNNEQTNSNVVGNQKEGFSILYNTLLIRIVYYT